VATVTRTATLTKTENKRFRNEHRRPPPGFIPGGGLRCSRTASASPVAHPPGSPVAVATVAVPALCPSVTPAPPAHTGPSRPHFTYRVPPSRDKTSFLVHQIRETSPPTRRRRAAGRVPGAGVRCEARGARWPGPGDVAAGARSGMAGRFLPGLHGHCPGASISKAQKGAPSRIRITLSSQLIT
jgi:hypothetical protein